MADIAQQLGLDATFFYQFALIAVLFLVLGPLYFKPFQKLFERRHERTVADREASEKMLEQAEAKLADYQRLIQEERATARKEFDAMIQEAKKEENAALSHARDEAKKIQQKTIDEIEAQRGELRKRLEADCDQIAKLVSDQLLSRGNS